MVALSSDLAHRPVFGLVYAWSGFAIMWVFWVSFVIFLCEPRLLLGFWPLQTVDHGGRTQEPWVAAALDLCLVALFALQHSIMARPWFKDKVARMPGPFARCTYVHMANAALFLLIIFWQPLPVDVWTTHEAVAQTALWALFAAGWVILVLRDARAAGNRTDAGLDQRPPAASTAVEDWEPLSMVSAPHVCRPNMGDEVLMVPLHRTCHARP